MTIRERLQQVAQAAGEAEYSDVYGGGALLEDFEQKLATLLGKESAVFMVSGTMAQQTALRVHCDRRARPVFACHPQSHLLASENDAYQRLLKHLRDLDWYVHVLAESAKLAVILPLLTASGVKLVVVEAAALPVLKPRGR